VSDEEPGREIARQDEVLELLYWLEGEGFTEHATLDGLARFLGWSADEARAVLEILVRRGDVAASDSGSAYRLTPVGRREAARRFAEEFAPLLGQGHGECNDPDCECHANPDAAAECHAARARAHDHDDLH
jgi:hypothetical protein